MKKILIIFSILIITDLKSAELGCRREINFKDITFQSDPTKIESFVSTPFDVVIAGITKHSEDKLGLFFIDMFLLTSNGDFNFQDKNGLTMLICAAKSGHLDLVKHLIELSKGKIDIVNKKNKHGNTALDYAQYCRHKDIVKFLQKFINKPVDI